MKRRLFLFALFAFFCGPSFAADMPNIIFIFSDDHAQHAISAYGSKVNQTPHIDRLAKEGARFTRSFVLNSICTPSRAALTPADGVPYPLYDLTTSGLNLVVPKPPEPRNSNAPELETKPAAPRKPQVNRYRLHERPHTRSHFGLMRIKWDGPHPSLRLEVCGLEGEVVISRDTPSSEIQPK